MARFTVTTSSGHPTTELSFSIEIPDGAGREYTTFINAGIAAVVTQGGVILIDSENDQDMKKALNAGLEMVRKIGI
jgi:hypothetical protein